MGNIGVDSVGHQIISPERIQALLNRMSPQDPAPKKCSAPHTVVTFVAFGRVVRLRHR